MKTLSNLTATPGDAPFSERRGSHCTLFEHPVLKGWFVRLQLGHAGLHFSHDCFGAELKRETLEVAIPLDALLALAAQHAPGLLPSDADLAAFNAAVRTAKPKS